MRSARETGHSLLVLVLVVAAAVAFFLLKPTSKKNPIAVPVLKTNQTYQEKSLKFEFKYPSTMDVVTETEDQYSTRTQTQYRKNFAGYVGYQPPKLITSLIVKPKELKLGSSQFDVIPLTIWVFENPQKLDGALWYKNYWYYPFVWGVFVTAQKNQIAPQTDATVSGMPTKSAVVGYSPGKPEYILLPKEDKMYLFKVMGGGTPILGSFRFD